jgi:hypothetical protein
MSLEEIYPLWAPPQAVWSRWAKPVLFAETGLPPLAPGLIEIPEPGIHADQQTAVIVDLPGAESVAAGLALARAGFRPVPLYNTSSHPFALVDTKPIVEALVAGAPELAGITLFQEATPAFLLDAQRLAPGKAAVPGRFDNRWVVFPQDFPSANFLLSRGVRRVVLLWREEGLLPEDLSHVLLRWQKAGIELWSCRPGGDLQPLTVARPSKFRHLWYVALLLLGLRRNSAGGFGSIVPTPSSGSG